jgi:hypothetical protein
MLNEEEAIDWMTGALGFNFWWVWKLFPSHCVQIDTTASSSMDTGGFLPEARGAVSNNTVSCYNYIASTQDE